MDNAVKALIMSAGVLIGIMILSLMVSLYASLNGFVEESQENIAKQEIQRFNEQFLKYINYDTVKIQDIVTAANIAYENNINGGTYVTINMPGMTNLERRIDTDLAQILEACVGNEYKCNRNNITFDQATGKVIEVTFHD